MSAVFLVEATFAPVHGRTFYLVGVVTSGEVRVGMKLALPLPAQSPVDRAIRGIEHTTDPKSACLALRYRDARERAELLRLDLRGRAVLVD
jgi:hypothetical protein